MINEKKHRLPDECYIGYVRCSFTICVENREKLFVDDNTVELFNNYLKKAFLNHNVKNWVYVYMPDHLHLVLEGNKTNSNLLQCVNEFKQRTGFWLSKNMRGIRWQKDFYDHIHRKDEDLRKQINYILDNPVRKGLVENWEDYKYVGSLDHEMKDIV